MGERSRRRVRDLVTQLAFEGLSENEIGRARISIMARSDLLHARAGYRSARPTTVLKIQLATHGRSSVRKSGPLRPTKRTSLRRAATPLNGPEADCLKPCSRLVVTDTSRHKKGRRHLLRPFVVGLKRRAWRSPTPIVPRAIVPGTIRWGVSAVSRSVAA